MARPLKKHSALKNPPSSDTIIEARPGRYITLPDSFEAQRLLKKPAVLKHKLTFATPEQIKKEGKNRVVRYGLHETPFGKALIAETDGMVCATLFATNGRNPTAELKKAWKYSTLVEDKKDTAKLAKAAFSKNPPALPLFLVGNEFNRKIWTMLLKIPCGTVVRYGDMAQAAGYPRAARAVGNAVGANPVSWLVPCHRVSHANGGLSGFGWGEPMKRDFLAAETR